MVENIQSNTCSETNFRLLSVAALLKKADNGISIDDLYRDAERKFDTLTGLLSDTYKDNRVLSENGYALDDLRRLSFLVFDRLISDTNSTPYMTLCALEDASAEEIKRRRNKLLHIFHPDRNSGEYADEAKTRRITEAYDKIIHTCRKGESPFTRNQSNLLRKYPYKITKNNFTLYLIFVIALLTVLGFVALYHMF